jgi:hypothetical protein
MSRKPDDAPNRYSLGIAVVIWLGLAAAAWLIIAAIVTTAYNLSDNSIDADADRLSRIAPAAGGNEPQR